MKKLLLSLLLLPALALAQYKDAAALSHQWATNLLTLNNAEFEYTQLTEPGYTLLAQGLYFTEYKKKLSDKMGGQVGLDMRKDFVGKSQRSWEVARGYLETRWAELNDSLALDKMSQKTELKKDYQTATGVAVKIHRIYVTIPYKADPARTLELSFDAIQLPEGWYWDGGQFRMPEYWQPRD